MRRGNIVRIHVEPPTSVVVSYGRPGISGEDYGCGGVKPFTIGDRPNSKAVKQEFT
jgi:hypothetical protein